VITTRVLGEERTVYDEIITIDENRVTNLTVPLPDVDIEAETELTDALEALANETNRLEMLLDSRGASELPGTFRGDPRESASGATRDLPVSRDLYLRSSDFLDPRAIREAAMANAARASDYRLAEARRLFADRRLTGRDRDPCGHLPDSGSLRIPRGNRVELRALR
jgi:hypothetical protein